MEMQSSTMPAPKGPQHASFWRRLHAYGIDSLLITILIILLHWQFGGVARAQSDSEAQIQALIGAGIVPPGTNAQNLRAQLFDYLSWSDVIFPMLVSAVYNIVFLAGAWQATPGKRFFNIHVTDAKGKRLSYEQSALRHAASGFSTLLFGLPYLTIFFTRERLAPHDMLCKTRVVLGRPQP